uniref:Ovule protein n=1 Tax=Mesocestoides corti TaxID=53468 RepID=A0A5K3FU03_MESCO
MFTNVQNVCSARARSQMRLLRWCDWSFVKKEVLALKTMFMWLQLRNSDFVCSAQSIFILVLPS